MPFWYHPCGYHMVVAESLRNKLVVVSKWAKLVVSAYKGSGDEKWSVHWEIDHGRIAGVGGQILFSSEELIAAFGCSERVLASHNELTKRYGADCGVQGKYIRQLRYLNIPCPGTGSDGDPNISAYITESIRLGVWKLLNAHTKGKLPPLPLFPDDVQEEGIVGS
ncbi:MAG: hypothetical protein M1153_02195 [Patescibacteria group bacterium]|nr:hypothetical protein [Patescibacteria group bacterium]